MSLAMWLRAGRSQRNLSLEDVARITKIQTRILEKLERQDYDPLVRRPTLTLPDGAVLAWRLITWRAGRHDLPRLARPGRESAASRHP